KVFDDLGWYSSFCDGHDFKDIEYVLDIECQNTPVIIKANTTKGKGVSFMENNNLFHYKAPNEEEYKQALKELNV
ncbi:MAG: transketolase, partial [Nanoarchaeota archaeon]